MLAPAGNDMENWGEATANAEALKKSACGDKCVWKPYPEMSHGWSVRGDVQDPKVKADVESVLADAIGFFNQYLKA